MDRLTSWNKDCVLINGNALGYATKCELVQMAERLAAYEGTGLEPEAVETVKLALAGKHLVDVETFVNTPIRRLVEIAEADKAGRVVVLPCKVGDTVWLTRTWVSERLSQPEAETMTGAYICGNGVCTFVTNKYGFQQNEIGKDVFFTREEAERAMEDRKEADHA